MYLSILGKWFHQVSFASACSNQPLIQFLAKIWFFFWIVWFFWIFCSVLFLGFFCFSDFLGFLLIYANEKRNTTNTNWKCTYKTKVQQTNNLMNFLLAQNSMYIPVHVWYRSENSWDVPPALRKVWILCREAVH